jgi:ribosomal RNA assembly protein
MTRLTARIPMDRVGAMIGPRGSAKRKIERSTATEIEVDSETGEITIIGEDAPEAMKAQEWVRAVGRGFSPQRAMRLLTDDVFLEVIDIREYIGKSRKRRFEVRGRVIGRDGRAREVIEELSGAAVSVMGNTVSVIGTAEENDIAHTALDMLLHGADHSQVYSFLEHRRRRARVADLLGTRPEDRQDAEEPDQPDEGAEGPVVPEGDESVGEEEVEGDEER